MTRHRTLSRRLRAVETLLAALTVKPVPRILFVRTFAGETKADAHAAFNARYGRDRNRRLLVVPAKPTNEAERTTFAERFREQQLRLVREARSRNTFVAAADPSFANPYVIATRAKKPTKPSPYGPAPIHS